MPSARADHAHTLRPGQAGGGGAPTATQATPAAPDLNALLAPHRETSFIYRMRGNAMTNAGISDGDLLVADRTMMPAHCDIVVAVVDAEPTVRTLFAKRNIIKLVAACEGCADIDFAAGDMPAVLGVVTHVIRRLAAPAAA